jgi:hypothetical protein
MRVRLDFSGEFGIHQIDEILDAVKSLPGDVKSCFRGICISSEPRLFPRPFNFDELVNDVDLSGFVDVYKLVKEDKHA